MRARFNWRAHDGHERLESILEELEGFGDVRIESVRGLPGEHAERGYRCELTFPGDDTPAVGELRATAAGAALAVLHRAAKETSDRSAQALAGLSDFLAEH